MGPLFEGKKSEHIGSSDSNPISVRLRSMRLPSAPLGSAWPVATLGSAWPVVTLGSSWLRLAPRDPWLRFAPRGYAWLLVATLGSAWPVVTLGSTWLCLAPFGSSTSPRRNNVCFLMPLGTNAYLTRNFETPRYVAGVRYSIRAPTRAEPQLHFALRSGMASISFVSSVSNLALFSVKTFTTSACETGGTSPISPLS